ncbi:unnamed protein product [Ectocarpus sp. 12 AP-2014]
MVSETLPSSWRAEVTWCVWGGSWSHNPLGVLMKTHGVVVTPRTPKIPGRSDMPGFRRPRLRFARTCCGINVPRGQLGVLCPCTGSKCHRRHKISDPLDRFEGSTYPHRRACTNQTISFS